MSSIPGLQMYLSGSTTSQYGQLGIGFIGTRWAMPWMGEYS